MQIFEIAKDFSVFGLSVLLGCGLGYGLSFGLMPAFYEGILFAYGSSMKKIPLKQIMSE